MGPEGEKKYTLCLCDLKLGNVPLKPDVIYSFTFSADVLTPEAMALFQPTELTMHFKTPKYWRCRSRKRFIKLARHAKSPPQWKGQRIGKRRKYRRRNDLYRKARGQPLEDSQREIRERGPVH